MAAAAAAPASTVTDRRRPGLYLNSPALVGLGRPPGPGQPGQAQGSLASPTDSLKPEPFASCG